MGSSRPEPGVGYSHVRDLEALLAAEEITQTAIVGCSMGGGLVSYDDAYDNNMKKIMTLPGDTVLACGHGPLTTVSQERRNNPFFVR